jgi:hypothetical protein
MNAELLHPEANMMTRGPANASRKCVSAISYSCERVCRKWPEIQAQRESIAKNAKKPAFFAKL